MTIFWLVVTVIGLAVSAWFIYQDGWHAGSMYLVFPFMSGVMYGFRVFMLHRINRQNNN